MNAVRTGSGSGEASARGAATHRARVPEPVATVEVEAAQNVLACSWCGHLSPPGPVCEACGSPMESGNRLSLVDDGEEYGPLLPRGQRRKATAAPPPAAQRQQPVRSASKLPRPPSSRQPLFPSCHAHRWRHPCRRPRPRSPSPPRFPGPGPPSPPPFRRRTQSPLRLHGQRACRLLPRSRLKPRRLLRRFRRFPRQHLRHRHEAGGYSAGEDPRRG